MVTSIASGSIAFTFGCATLGANGAAMVLLTCLKKSITGSITGATIGVIIGSRMLSSGEAGVSTIGAVTESGDVGVAVSGVGAVVSVGVAGVGSDAPLGAEPPELGGEVEVVGEGAVGVGAAESTRTDVLAGSAVALTVGVGVGVAVAEGVAVGAAVDV